MKLLKFLAFAHKWSLLERAFTLPLLYVLKMLLFPLIFRVPVSADNSALES